MSRKRKSRPGGGNIKFVGLRYFLALSEGRVSRKKLIEIIRRFFTSRGLEVPDNLVVEFRMTRRPTSVIGGTTARITGLSYRYEHRVVIYAHGRSFVEVLQTLHHELDHEAWKLEGNALDFSKAYRSRPHEKRAYANESRWDHLARRQAS